jgi:hypothetical protein
MHSRLLVAGFLTAFSLPANCQSPPATNLTTVPDSVLYDHFMFRVTWLESQANNLKAEGKNDSSLRSWIQRNAGLTSRETANLKAISADYQTKTSAIVGAVQALATAGTNLASSQQAQSLLSQRQQTVLDHISQLQTAFGPARYAVLDSFVRQTVKIQVGPAAPLASFVKPPPGPAPPK